MAKAPGDRRWGFQGGYRVLPRKLSGLHWLARLHKMRIQGATKRSGCYTFKIAANLECNGGWGDPLKIARNQLPQAAGNVKVSWKFDRIVTRQNHDENCKFIHGAILAHGRVG